MGRAAREREHHNPRLRQAQPDVRRGATSVPRRRMSDRESSAVPLHTAFGSRSQECLRDLTGRGHEPRVLQSPGTGHGAAVCAQDEAPTSDRQRSEAEPNDSWLVRRQSGCDANYSGGSTEAPGASGTDDRGAPPRRQGLALGPSSGRHDDQGSPISHCMSMTSARSCIQASSSAGSSGAVRATATSWRSPRKRVTRARSSPRARGAAAR